jgi:hypothetical protein
VIVVIATDGVGEIEVDLVIAFWVAKGKKKG